MAKQRAEIEGVVAPSLTPESYNPIVALIGHVLGCSSLSHPGKLQSSISNEQAKTAL